jgi:putative redox protein
MSGEVKVQMQQQSATTTKGQARQHSVLIDRPLASDGTDQGPMGGELLLIALGGCFMSNLLAAIRTRQAAVSDVNVEVVATKGENPTRFTAVKLLISAQYEDAAEIEKLVTIAERGCLVANSIRGAIDLSFEIAPVTTASPT